MNSHTSARPSTETLRGRRKPPISSISPCPPHPPLCLEQPLAHFLCTPPPVYATLCMRVVFLCTHRRFFCEFLCTRPPVFVYATAFFCVRSRRAAKRCGPRLVANRRQHHRRQLRSRSRAEGGRRRGSAARRRRPMLPQRRPGELWHSRPQQRWSRRPQQRWARRPQQRWSCRPQQGWPQGRQHGVFARGPTVWLGRRKSKRKKR